VQLREGRNKHIRPSAQPEYRDEFSHICAMSLMLIFPQISGNPHTLPTIPVTTCVHMAGKWGDTCRGRTEYQLPHSFELLQKWPDQTLNPYGNPKYP
jgi:hypothetical protein